MIGECINQGHAEPIAKFETVGNAEIDMAGGHHVQCPHGKCRTGRTIGIKITHDQYALPCDYGICDDIRCLADAG